MGLGGEWDSSGAFVELHVEREERGPRDQGNRDSAEKKNCKEFRGPKDRRGQETLMNF